MSNAFNRESMIDVWHRRLGHLNEWDLKNLLKYNAAYGLKFNGRDRLKECKTCIKGKLSSLKFPKTSRRDSKPLDIIHSDLCGPMQTTSLGGNRYFITFIDDATGFIEVGFLKHKNEVLDVFKNFKNKIENVKGTKIKCIQSDNGTEYCNKDFDRFLDENGITRRLTVPATPQQNGVAERMNRTLVEMARCMLIGAKLPPEFWAEAVSTASYIRNRCPSKRLNGENPYFCWFGRKPTLSYFKTFGTPGYCLNRNNRDKFGEKTNPCLFLGYSNQSKGYRVWLSDQRKVVTIRNVRFLKEIDCQDSNLNVKEDLINYIEYSCEYPKISNSKNKNYEPPADSGGDDPPDDPWGEPGVNPEVDPEGDYSPPDPVLGEDRSELVSPGGELRSDEPVQGTVVRGPGRPKILRTGNRGRPRKIYNTYVIPEINNKNDIEAPSHNPIAEISNAAEVSISDAFSSPYATDWQRAIEKEFASILRNNTFEICRKPTDRDVISSRLILCIKYNSEGQIERRKARLVARGFTQKPGVDFHETFSPVVRLSSIRTVMALAAEHNLIVHQADVETAYLNGDLDETIFMEIPDMMNEALIGIIGS